MRNHLFDLINCVCLLNEDLEHIHYNITLLQIVRKWIFLAHALLCLEIMTNVIVDCYGHTNSIEEDFNPSTTLRTEKVPFLAFT
jgi:hypothetical protein